MSIYDGYITETKAKRKGKIEKWGGTRKAKNADYCRSQICELIDINSIIKALLNMNWMQKGCRYDMIEGKNINGGPILVHLGRILRNADVWL